MGRILGLLTAVAIVVALAPAAAGAAEPPPLRTPEWQLSSALDCPSILFLSPHEPVLLVHGTGSSPDAWAEGYAPALTSRGFDVCTIQLPGEGLIDIQVASEYVVWAVRHMAKLSGQKVDMVGHSQGGIEMMWAVKWWPDVQASTDDVVTLGTAHHGGGDIRVNRFFCHLICPTDSSVQQTTGSNFMRALNSGDETPGEVSYTSIWSYSDEVVQPWAGGRRTSDLTGGSNFNVQDFCGKRLVRHVDLLFDGPSFAAALDALGGAGPMDPGRLPAGYCASPDIYSGPGNPPAGLLGSALGLVGGTTDYLVKALGVTVQWTLRAGKSEPPLAPYARGAF